MQLIDTHAHLNDDKFAHDLDDVIARASDAGVSRIIVCGYDIPSSRAAVKMAAKYESVYATVGVHPHDARHFSDEAAEHLVELSREKKVLAIGEIGLDFHYDFSPRQDQARAFAAQIEIAASLELPIVVHSRESDPEAMQVLREHLSNIVGCVFHCFSGSADFAKEVLDLGFYIGVDGPITYKASAKLRGIIEACPMDRILIETDCPYLTPIPFRGKRNEPAHVQYVAEEIARVKSIPLQIVAAATWANAEKLFNFDR